MRALLAGEGGNMTLTPVPDPAPAGQVFVIESIGWWSEDVQGPGDRCRKCGWPREDHAATSITKEWVDDATRACGWCIVRFPGRASETTFLEWEGHDLGMPELAWPS